MEYKWKFKPDPNKPDYILANIEEFTPEHPTMWRKPYGMRLQNGNFIWTTSDHLEKIEK